VQRSHRAKDIVKKVNMSRAKQLKTKLRNVALGGELKSKVMRGGVLLGAGSGTEQMFRLLRNMLLTRILAPEAFGLMAIVLAINAAFESFTEIGIKEAVIQNPEGQTDTYLNGAWWLALGRAVILYAIVFVSAPLISNFYSNPELTPLMRVTFLNLFFTGIMSAKAYVAVKRMNFTHWVTIFHGGGVIGILTSIVMAFLIPNVWALAIGFTVEAVARFLLSYVICPFRPRFNFNKNHLRGLFQYSKGMFGLPILTFIFMRADVFVIGKLYPMAELGLYSMASLLAWIPFNFLTMIIGQIMMPAFSERQADKEFINKWTLNVTSIVALFGFPLLLFAALYGGDILTLMYGSKYGVMGVPFAIIIANALMRTSSVPLAAVYLATGRPELHRLFTGIRALLIVILMYPAIRFWGLRGAATAGLVSMLVGYIFQVKRMEEITGLDTLKYFYVFLPAFLISLFILILWIITKDILPSLPAYHMISGIVGCIIAYGLAIFFYMKSRVGPFSFLKS